jgi:DNA mismatch repair protein MutL
MDFDQETPFSKPATRPLSFRPNNGSKHAPQPPMAPPPDLPGPPTPSSGNPQDWQKLYEGLDQFVPPAEPTPAEPLTLESKASAGEELDKGFNKQQRAPYQLHATYIVSPIRSGFLLIDQQSAHERILFEKYLRMMEEQNSPVQKALFPQTLQLTPADAELLRVILDQINGLGFDIQEFGGDTFVVHGIPADAAGQASEQKMVETLLDQYKENLEFDLGVNENLARAMARSAAIKRGQLLSETEMQSLIDQLFACSIPYKSPSGRHCFITFDQDDLERRFSG